jgi:hypothetical protein
MASSKHDRIMQQFTGSGGVVADPRSAAGGCGSGQSRKCGSLGGGVDLELAALGLHPSAPNNKSGSVLTAATTKPSSATTYSAQYDEHDQAVMKRINRFIDLANGEEATTGDRVELVNIKMIKDATKSAPPPTDGTIAEKLDWCWSQNITFRVATDTMDPVGRDADYYFAARHSIAGEKHTIWRYLDKYGGEQLWTVYSAEKLYAILLGHDEWTRTDKDQPNAMPGGIDWLIRGANDGIDDEGQSNDDVPEHTPARVRIWNELPVYLGSPLMAVIAAFDLLINRLRAP